MTRARQREKPPYNVHDVQATFSFSGIRHERCTFPHVHDVHDVHPSDAYSVVKDLVPLPRWAGGQAIFEKLSVLLCYHILESRRNCFFEKFSRVFSGV